MKKFFRKKKILLMSRIQPEAFSVGRMKPD